VQFTPNIINAEDFQGAWFCAVRAIKDAKWEMRNLIVQIQNPRIHDEIITNKISSLAENCGTLLPKHVAYTIFPHGLYDHLAGRDPQKLYELYNRKRGLFERLHSKVPHSWGTYFRRMTNYETGEGKSVNQLDKVIQSSNKCPKYKAAHLMIIPHPEIDGRRLRAHPCLNYLTPQFGEIENNPAVGLLAVYRNHDFLERAYGNYWGLCNLLQFIAEQTNRKCGPLTCVSSHAYVGKEKNKLKSFLAANDR
jgi:thymidylate synthase